MSRRLEGAHCAWLLLYYSEAIKKKKSKLMNIAIQTTQIPQPLHNFFFKYKEFGTKHLH